MNHLQHILFQANHFGGDGVPNLRCTTWQRYRVKRLEIIGQNYLPLGVRGVARVLHDTAVLIGTP